MRPFVRIRRANSSRRFIRRWHANQELTAWRDRRAKAGASLGLGRWRMQVALLHRRGTR